MASRAAELAWSADSLVFSLELSASLAALLATVAALEAVDAAELATS